jgi:N-carbamoyl-L-amino-acid hydrolase
MKTHLPQAEMTLDLLRSRELAGRIFADIAGLTKDVRGVSRESYGFGETEAIDYLINEAKKMNLNVHTDAAANVIFQIGEEMGKHHILTGSHMDSVPQGGNFDGLAGVVAGLTVLSDFMENNIRPEIPLKVIALRGEESAWYGRNYVGAKSLFGTLKEADLQALHRDNGRTLLDAMGSVGADVELIKAGKKLIKSEEIVAFIELHIEQGPILVDRNWPVAIVTGIRGNIRHLKIQCIGSAGHSGAVPRWLRQDAVFATADLISRMDDHWTTILQHGGDLVLTCGIFHTDSQHHAMSRIPGEVSFSFEARSQDQATLKALEALLKSECATVQKERRVDFEFDEASISAPALLDEKIIKQLVTASINCGLPDETIPSGAGHDASIFANAGVPSGMIFVRNENGSHNPDEEMEINDFLAGVSVLKNFVMSYQS